MDVLVYFLLCSDILFCEFRPLMQTGLDARCALFLYARGVVEGHAWRDGVGALANEFLCLFIPILVQHKAKSESSGGFKKAEPSGLKYLYRAL